ncbi:MAG: GNAT family N-acetyltransferase, partial [Achromobacter sp.]
MLHIHTADFRSARDAAEVVDLLDAYARDPMGGGAPLSAHTRTHLAAELAKRPHAHALIARMDDAPAG